MPQAAGLAASVGASMAAGAAAAGSALAAGAAAIGTAASAGMAAVGGLSGLATGISIASSAIGLVGMATGSKTLQKVGSIGGMIGGVGLGASALSKAATAGSALSGAASTESALSSAVTSPIINSAENAAIFSSKAFPAGGNAISNAASPGGLLKTSNTMASGKNASAGVIPSETSSGNTNIAQRMNELLTKYDTTANVLSGIGMGYIQSKNYDLQKDQTDLMKDKFAFEKEQYNTQQKNRNAVPVLPASFGGIKKADGSPLLATQ